MDGRKGMRVKALMEANPTLKVAAINIVTTVPEDVGPKELQTTLGALFGYQVEIVAYEDEEKDQITVTGPQSLEEARDVWKRGAVNPLKLWVRAIGKLPDSLEQSADLQVDDTYWNDRDVGSSDIVSFAPPLPFQQVVPASPVGRARRDTLTNSGGIRFTRTTKILGRGAYGVVFQGVREDDGSLIAVKEMSFPREETDSTTLKKLLEIDKEIACLQKLEHVHIVRYLGSVRTLDAVQICLEYADGGSLLNHIQDFGKTGLAENVVKDFTRQILLGLNYLHKQNVVHRDVKSGNILMHNREGGRALLKLSDFGCARIFGGLKMSSDTAGGGQAMYGTPHWMAPEVIQSIPAGRASDIWSLGCVVVEMVTGKRPWATLGNLDVLPLLYKIAQAKTGPPVPKEALSTLADDFLQLCFKTDPQQRATTDTLLEHGFIVGGMEGTAVKEKKKMLAKANQLVRGLVKTINSTQVYEVMVCGHNGVGKTSVVVQFVHQHRVEYYAPTEDQRYQKQLSLDSTSVVLDILDPGRQGVSSALHQKMLESAHGFLIVFSVTDRVSFERIAYFVQLIRTANKRPTGPSIVLVGNKCDLVQERVIKTDEARAVVQQLNLAGYCETSGSDAGVLNVFMTLVAQMQEANPSGSSPSSSSSSSSASSGAKEGALNNNNNNGNATNGNSDVKSKEDAAKKCVIM